MTSAIPIVTTPPPEETLAFQTVPAAPLWTAIPRLDTKTLPGQPMAHQEEQQRALQDNIKRKAVWQWDELANEWAAIGARLVDLHQHESALEVGRAIAIERAEWHLPTTTSSDQNMAAVATLLYTLPVLSTDGVGEVY
jgi:hypothetical protein